MPVLVIGCTSRPNSVNLLLDCLTCVTQRALYENRVTRILGSNSPPGNGRPAYACHDDDLKFWSIRCYKLLLRSAWAPCERQDGLNEQPGAPDAWKESLLAAECISLQRFPSTHSGAASRAGKSTPRFIVRIRCVFAGYPCRNGVASLARQISVNVLPRLHRQLWFDD